MVLNGVVRSGYGNAEFWVNKIFKAFEEKYAMKLFPGTLNIELSEPYIMKDVDKISPVEYGRNI